MHIFRNPHAGNGVREPPRCTRSILASSKTSSFHPARRRYGNLAQRLFHQSFLFRVGADETNERMRDGRGRRAQRCIDLVQPSTRHALCDRRCHRVVRQSTFPSGSLVCIIGPARPSRYHDHLRTDHQNAQGCEETAMYVVWDKTPGSIHLKLRVPSLSRGSRPAFCRFFTLSTMQDVILPDTRSSSIISSFPLFPVLITHAHLPSLP